MILGQDPSGDGVPGTIPTVVAALACTMTASAPFRTVVDPSGLVIVTAVDTMRLLSGTPADRTAVVLSALGVSTAPVLSGSVRVQAAVKPSGSGTGAFLTSRPVRVNSTSSVSDRSKVVVIGVVPSG